MAEVKGRRENITFEVPASDAPSGGDSLIKRHPPKKWQKLEEQQNENLTQELLEQKQTTAEERRNKILNQRVKSAKTTSARSAQARARVAESKEVDKLEGGIETGNDQVGL